MSAGYVVLSNARAGSADRRQVQLGATRLEAGGPVEVVETDGPEDLDDPLGMLEGRDVVVAGGDGSVHLVVRRLRDLGLLESVTVGLLPLGTGNDLARGQRIPLDVEEAADVILQGTVRRLDVLVDDAGGIAVNAVHAGLGARAAQRSDSLKSSLGPLAYPVGALIAAAGEDGWELSVHIDGDALEFRGHVLMVAVANGPTIGGGTPLCPVARADDGRLDVVVVGAMDRAARVGFAADLRTGEHLARDDVWHAKGHEVRVHGQPVPFNADGEVSEPDGDRTYRVQPAVLALLTPG